MKKIFFIMAFLLPMLSYGQDAETLRKANAGDVKAQYEMYRFYSEGIETDEPLNDEARSWLIKSAENGHASAQWRLKMCYENGFNGFVPDNDQYVYWLTKLAKNGSVEEYDKFDISNAQHDLAELYKKGEKGLPKSIPDYLKWMKKAVYNGSHPAALDLGYYYKWIDKQEAVYWLKKCMDMVWAKYQEEDEPAAEELRELGVYYHPGDNVANNSNSHAHAGSTGSSTTTSSAERQPKATGTYTISSQGQSIISGNYTEAAGPDLEVTIEFYDDGITVGGIWCEYAGTSSTGKKIYNDPMSFGGSSSKYYVDGNYNVLKQTSFSSPFGSDIFNYSVVKGRVIIPKAAPYRGLDANNGGYSSGSSHSEGTHQIKTHQKDCHLCHGSGKCNTCNGTHRYLNPLTNKYITCPNCKPNGACSACGGTGKQN